MPAYSLGSLIRRSAVVLLVVIVLIIIGTEYSGSNDFAVSFSRDVVVGTPAPQSVQSSTPELSSTHAPRASAVRRCSTDESTMLVLTKRLAIAPPPSTPPSTQRVIEGKRAIVVVEDQPSGETTTAPAAGNMAAEFLSIVKQPRRAMQPQDISQMSFLGSLVSPSSGEEGTLLSPIALDYRSEHVEATEPARLSSRRIVFFETELVSLDTRSTSSAQNGGHCDKPRTVVADYAALLRKIEQLSLSGTLRRGTVAEAQGDAWILVLPCFPSWGSSCPMWSMNMTHAASDAPQRAPLHTLRSSIADAMDSNAPPLLLQELLDYPIFVLPVVTSELAFKTQQSLYRAASIVLALYDIPSGRGQSADDHPPLVAVLQLDELLICEDVFKYFVHDGVKSPTIYAVGFRNETESQKKFGCCWFAQASGHALGTGEQLPGELVGQPVLTHYFLGSNSLPLLRSFLVSSFRTTQEYRDGDSVAPVIARALVVEYRAHVFLLNGPHVSGVGDGSLRAKITDANETVCGTVGHHNNNNTNVRADAFSEMCYIPGGSSVSGDRAKWTMIVETKSCHELPRAAGIRCAAESSDNIRGVSRRPTSVPFADLHCPTPPVVAADVIVVNTVKTPALVDELSSLFPSRQRALKDLLMSAAGHYGLKGEAVIKDRGRASSLVNITTAGYREDGRCDVAGHGWTDVVIAYAAGYSSPATIAPLLNSFRTFHTRGCTKLYLFVLAEHVDAFSREDPDIIPISVGKYRDGFLRTAKCKLLKQRKEVIYLWLKENLMGQVRGVESDAEAVRPFRYIMMIDSRDMLFQADPFLSMARIDSELQRWGSTSGRASNGFMLFPPETAWFGEMEWAFRGGFEFNMKWVLEAFGFAYMQRMFQARLPVSACLSLNTKGLNSNARRSLDRCVSLPVPIVCGGIYAGTSIAMLDFLKLLVNAMSARPQKQQDCHNDQGMMNGLLGGGGFALAGFPHHILVTNPYTTAYTHRPRRGSLRWGGEPPPANATSASLPQLLNCIGDPYAVVHQLDRFPSIWKQLQDAQLSPTKSLG